MIRNLGWLVPSSASAVGLTVGVVASSVVVLQSSGAVLNATTDNGNSNFAAGTVTLTDDDSTSVLFSNTDLVPGTTLTKCIKVDYTGSTFQLTPVKLYASIPTQTNAFANYLDFTIEEGTGGTFADCTGFTAASTLKTDTLANIATSHSNFNTGITAFTPASGSVTRTYKFTVTLNANTPNASQGDSATARFTWEVQSS